MKENRKYTLDNSGALENYDKGFIGVPHAMKEQGMGGNKLAGVSGKKSNRSRTLQSPRLLDGNNKVGSVAEKQHDMFWAQVLNEDAHKHKIQTDRKKIELRQNNGKIQDYLKSQMVNQHEAQKHEAQISK